MERSRVGVGGGLVQPEVVPGDRTSLAATTMGVLARLTPGVVVRLGAVTRVPELRLPGAGHQPADYTAGRSLRQPWGGGDEGHWAPRLSRAAGGGRRIRAGYFRANGRDRRDRRGRRPRPHRDPVFGRGDIH